MNRLLFAAVWACACAFAQPAAPIVSAQAALSKAASVLNGPLPVTSIHVSGTAAYTSGSDADTAKVTLTSSAPRQADVLIQRSSETFRETRNADGGTWSEADGTAHPIALHNTWTTAAWFAPALIVNEWLTDPGLVLDSVTAEDRDGVPVQRITCHRELAGQMSQGTHDAIAEASRMDLFLDSTTFLPLALEFNLHPDENEARNVPVRIEYAAYQSAQGGQAPFRIKQYLNGSLYLDISVQNVSINPAAGQEGN